MTPLTPLSWSCSGTPPALCSAGPGDRPGPRHSERRRLGASTRVLYARQNWALQAVGAEAEAIPAVGPGQVWFWDRVSATKAWARPPARWMENSKVPSTVALHCSSTLSDVTVQAYTPTGHLLPLRPSPPWMCILELPELVRTSTGAASKLRTTSPGPGSSTRRQCVVTKPAPPSTSSGGASPPSPVSSFSRLGPDQGSHPMHDSPPSQEHLTGGNL